MPHERVLISGAGIAGITLAHWLHHHGFTPIVVERAPAPRAGGYKVDIRGAALSVVERMGLTDAIRAARTDIQGGAVVTATGKRVASMDGDSFGGREHEDSELPRGELGRLLYEATEKKADFRFGDSITALDQTGDGVEVTFASGTTERFDLVVGADGLHSATRALAFGPEDQYVRDLGYYVSVYTVPNHLNLDREELTYVGPGRTALMYSTAGDPNARAMFLWSSPPLEYDRSDANAQRELLRDAYADEGWEVPTLLEAAETTPDFYFDTLSQVHMDHWFTGKVALVGDAAHCASAASGQGTSLALVGGYVLAGELSRAKDPTAAFAAYEQRMRGFAETNQALGPANIKRMVLRGKGQIRVAMTMLALMSRMPGKERMMARVAATIHKAATAIDLPDYEAAD